MAARGILISSRNGLAPAVRCANARWRQVLFVGQSLVSQHQVLGNQTNRCVSRTSAGNH